MIDWHAHSTTEPFDELIRFTTEGFCMATRLRSKQDWQKLKRDPNFYSFPAQFSSVALKKIFLLHCFDDMVVPIGPALESVKTQKFSQHYFKPHGGHLGVSCLNQLFFWHKIKKFLDTK